MYIGLSDLPIPAEQLDDYSAEKDRNCESKIVLQTHLAAAGFDESFP